VTEGDLRHILLLATAFREEAQAILARAEGARARAIRLADTAAKLAKLTAVQRELLGEAVKCAEYGFNRAAVVLAWAALVGLLHDRCEQDGFAKLNAARPTWAIATRDQMRQQVKDFQLIEALRVAGFLRAKEERRLKALLDTRNDAAHPGVPAPTQNVTLGTLDHVLQYLGSLDARPM
jgi:hypothetical protein